MPTNFQPENIREPDQALKLAVFEALAVICGGLSPSILNHGCK
jgi:hypothetical protein